MQTDFLRPRDMNGLLVLADGTRFEGCLWGSPQPMVGELVFNTSVVGYQEIATDPSYHRQIVVLTSPEIGNYGTSPQSVESHLAHAAGIVVRHISPRSTHRTSQGSFSDFLSQIQVPCLAEVPTRLLTHRIRDRGPGLAWMGPADTDRKTIQAMLSGEPPMAGANLVPEVSIGASQEHGSGKWTVVLLDFGIKANTMRHLVARNCRVIQVPWNTSLDSILSYQPDGIMLSNGPGDPDAVPGVREVVGSLMDELPTFGICLGFQIMALALGGRTYKLPFGHRGGNHPVKDLATSKVSITSQNHGFAVDVESLPSSLVEATHVSLFDGSLEGIQLKAKPCFGVQFHPEAAPGPRDCSYLFDRFIEHMEQNRAEA